MTTTTTNNIATSSDTLCSEYRTTINNSYTACAAGDSDSDGDIVSSKTRGGDRNSSKGNFATQTEGILREEKGSQVQRKEEEVANEERKEGEKSELARLRISLIEAKVD